MKVLVLLSLVALCLSTPISVGRRVVVSEDGHITVTGTDGKEINICKNLMDPTKISIAVKTPYGLEKHIIVDGGKFMKHIDFNLLDTGLFKDAKYWTGYETTQEDVLASIFRAHQGLIDDVTFNKIMDKVEYLVKEGVLKESILEALRYFRDMHMDKSMYGTKTFGDVMDYPVESRVHQVSEYMPFEGVSGFKRYYGNYLPYQVPKTVNEKYGEWTPYNRFQMLLQHLNQQGYGREQFLNQDVYYPEYKKEQEMKDEFIRQQVWKHMMEQMQPEMYHQQGLEKYYQQFRMTPFNRFWYNQQTFYPQQWTYPMQEQYFNTRLVGEVFPQEFDVKTQMYPHQYIRGVDQGLEQREFVPQEWNMQRQQLYGRVPMVY